MHGKHAVHVAAIKSVQLVKGEVGIGTTNLFYEMYSIKTFRYNGKAALEFRSSLLCLTPTA